MDTSLGASLDQAQNIDTEDMNVGRNIAQMNNKRMQDYLTNLGKQHQADSHQEEINLGKLGGYAMGIKEKYGEYTDAMKVKGAIPGIKGSKLLYKWPATAGSELGKLGPEAKAVKKGLGSLGEGIADLPGTIARSGALGEGVQSRALFQQYAERQTSQAPEEPTEEPPSEEPTEEPPSEEPPSEEPSELTTEEPTTELTETPDDATPQEPGEDHTGGGDADKPSSTLEDIGKGAKPEEEKVAGGLAKGVMKGAGAIFSAGMLGDDVYNQITKKKFFYGDNTGDKVGNFTNELGSAADVLGIMTGDPFLIMAGVGLGATGSVISDISELFGHHKKETTTKTDTKPKATIAPPQQNIAGQGGVAETGLSTLKQVQVGAS